MEILGVNAEVLQLSRVVSDDQFRAIRKIFAAFDHVAVGVQLMAFAFGSPADVTHTDGSEELFRMCFVAVPPAFQRQTGGTIHSISNLDMFRCFVDEFQIEFDVVVSVRVTNCRITARCFLKPESLHDI